MFTCTVCKKEIKDGQAIITVNEGSVFNDGEVDYENTEHFHSTCITIDY